MITKTASEIIREAKWLSNTKNSTLTDFYINSMLLNSIYQSLYADIINNDNVFIETMNTNENVVDITNAFKVVSITIGGKEVVRSALRNNALGGYYIENNKLYLPSGNKVIKYCSLPATITCPDEYKKVDIQNVPAPGENRAANEDGTIGMVNSFIYYGKLYNPMEHPEWAEKEGTSIYDVHYSDPYCFVTYADGTVRLYSSPSYYTDWNPFVSKSLTHELQIIAFSADATTGKGVIFKDKRTSTFYYGSFVPDTVLSFPNNTVFDLMVKKLAAILASMLSIENPYLTNTLLPEAEEKFYMTLSKGSATRVNNVYR